jgi:hypothetical protein
MVVATSKGCKNIRLIDNDYEKKLKLKGKLEGEGEGRTAVSGLLP